MSENHPNLVAWLDGELTPPEAAALTLHLESCEACSREVAAFCELSVNLQLFADATFAAASVRPKVSSWTPAFAALAAAAVLTAFIAFPRKYVAPSAPVAVVASTVALAPGPSGEPQVPVSAQQAVRRHLPVVSHPSAATQPPADTTVEIAIPADAVFAPGAFPEGMRLLGEMRIGPDGSLREVRLRQ